MSNIIPFPKRNDPSTAQDFPPGRQVLAVYPGTTALYKATVVNNNRKRKTDEEASLDGADMEVVSSLPQACNAFIVTHTLHILHQQDREGVLGEQRHVCSWHPLDVAMHPHMKKCKGFIVIIIEEMFYKRKIVHTFFYFI
ncbi:SAGA-associated factor 29 homolog B-like isoform X6 [Carya illinoinensis]|nr:SAGA-associated factor 29 homolog B-like isoform X6 [Carya illinoinensis]XP_042960923.1 SAGA-associated factor 29 homolog B-like isoform X6 [Carya illinoinensis]